MDELSYIEKQYTKKTMTDLLMVAAGKEWWTSSDGSGTSGDSQSYSTLLLPLWINDH